MEDTTKPTRKTIDAFLARLVPGIAVICDRNEHLPSRDGLAGVVRKGGKTSVDIVASVPQGNIAEGDLCSVRPPARVSDYVSIDDDSITYLVRDGLTCTWRIVDAGAVDAHTAAQIAAASHRTRAIRAELAEGDDDPAVLWAREISKREGYPVAPVRPGDRVDGSRRRATPGGAPERGTCTRLTDNGAPCIEFDGETVAPVDARSEAAPADAPGDDDLCWSCQEQATRFTAGGEGRCAACPDEYSEATDKGHESDMSHAPGSGDDVARLDARSEEVPVEFGAAVELYTPADALNPEEWTPAREIIGATLAEAIAGGITCAHVDDIEHPATRLYDVADVDWFAYCWLHGRTRTPVTVITGDARLDARLARSGAAPE